MYQLRDYQQDAVNSTLRYFKACRDPAVIVLPTGAGKSLVIAELARIAQGRVLVLAHVKELVEQNHSKFQSYGIKAGIYSAGLNQKSSRENVIFGSIQSVANAPDAFFNDFTLLIIDECHRVSLTPDTQYAQVIKKLKTNNPKLCVLGLTATPYRLGIGWIYNHNHRGELKTDESRFFKNCIFELPLQYMIRQNYLTRPVKIDIPVTSYDFSELTTTGESFSTTEIEKILQKQRRLTPLIVKNIIDITESYHRKGVMIFSSSVQHAGEILEALPEGEGQIVLGETEASARDQIIESFKRREFKYLVNVSVLTTGFDAPHVDVIAILRPTESVSLYQQIIGRGLRLDDAKKDCYILDYAGMNYNIYTPEISDKKTTKDSEPVQVQCPECGFTNDFWGRINTEGDVIEHFGRKCRGGSVDADTYEFKPCGYRFRFKLCDQCGEQNDISARKCSNCKHQLSDAETKLKQARLSKHAHVLAPDSVEISERFDKVGNPFLEVKYYDYDAQHLSEVHFLNNETSLKKFDVNFLRSHLRRPEVKPRIRSVDDVMQLREQMRMPAFVIGRKQGKYWKITEKIFAEELT